MKLKTAAKAFEVRGTGSETSRTFAIGDEDHTLGNALRHVLIKNGKVGFSGYSVPHPSEPVVQIRVQANKPHTAIGVLEEAATTLRGQCDVVLEKLAEKFPEIVTDYEETEAKLNEWDEEEEGDGEGGDAMEED